MCGIAGEVSWREGARAGEVSRLVSCLSHRGPDSSGLWTSPTGACTLGHARLSVIDLSPLGHQPMLDGATGNAIVFNGEIYNFAELRRTCEEKGDTFRSQSDTEVILALYRRHGLDFVRHLRGMFAIALWDAQLERLVLARDRVGKKPLNYALTSSGIVFSSELDPLSRHPQVSSAMDMQALELYLQLEYVPEPWTIYQQIRKLPPAHVAVFDRAGMRSESYWDVFYRPDRRITLERAADELEDKLTKAVQLRLVADVPVGALLSGGVDSSLVVALMAKLSNQPVETFSIGFNEEAFNELPYAEQVANAFKTNHHPQVVQGNVESLLPLIARRYGEPFADPSAVPSFFVSRAAREQVTVALNGDGGDELLGGYPRYSVRGAGMRVSGMLDRFFTPRSTTSLVPWATRARGLPSRIARRLLLDYGKPELRSLLMYQSYWGDDARAELMNGHSEKDLLPAWRQRWLAAANEHASNPIDRMLWIDNRTYLSGDLLVKMDIAAMHCGLETRSPLLDHEVIEYCATLPPHLKVDRGRGKFLLKYIAERHFPAAFVHRKKMGFGIPTAEWLRGPLRGTLYSVLRDRDVMAPFSASRIEELLRAFEASDLDVNRVWALFMYGMWHLSRFGSARQ